MKIVKINKIGFQHDLKRRQNWVHRRHGLSTCPIPHLTAEEGAERETDAGVLLEAYGTGRGRLYRHIHSCTPSRSL